MNNSILTIIIGKSSNLSIELDKSIGTSVLISTLCIENELNLINFKNYDSVNIVFNQFQKSTMLYNVEEPIEYLNRSIISTSTVLSYIKNKKIKINKMIYTSSSSVYGNNTHCSEQDDLNPNSLHASLKISNEKLIELFCKENDINYSIARVFNMYGGNDNFSIVSKIINAYKNKQEINLINNGEAIRDFISIEDTVYIYKRLLFEKNTIKIINIGTGIGKSVLFILDFLRKNEINISSKSTFRDELMVSISDKKLLKEFLPNHQFVNVEEYIYKKLESTNE